jgi:hypothetical protein
MMDALLIIGSLSAGLLLGGWGYRTFLADQRAKQLESELTTLREEYEGYQVSVSRYFERTATLANQLTDSYRDMHEHLRSGAQTLSQQPIAWNSRSSSAPTIEHHEVNDERSSSLTPPKDY